MRPGFQRCSNLTELLENEEPARITPGSVIDMTVEKARDYHEATASEGDIMRVPKEKAHSIVTVGDRASLRLAIRIPDIPHIDSTSGEVFD